MFQRGCRVIVCHKINMEPQIQPLPPHKQIVHADTLCREELVAIVATHLNHPASASNEVYRVGMQAVVKVSVRLGVIRSWLLANRSYTVLSLADDVPQLAVKVAKGQEQSTSGSLCTLTSFTLQ